MANDRDIVQRYIRWQNESAEIVVTALAVMLSCMYGATRTEVDWPSKLPELSGAISLPQLFVFIGFAAAFAGMAFRVTAAFQRKRLGPLKDAPEIPWFYRGQLRRLRWALVGLVLVELIGLLL